MKTLQENFEKDINLKSRLLILGILFIYIYGLQFRAIPVNSTKFVFLLSGIIFLFSSKVQRNRIKLKLSAIKVCMLLLLVAAYNIGISIALKTGDFNLGIAFTTVLLINFIGSYFLVNILHVWFGFGKEAIIKFIVITVLIQSLFIFTSFFSSAFREISHRILEEGGNLDALGRGRVRGFANASGAGISLVQGIGGALALSLALSSKRKKKMALFSMIAVLCAMSTIFTGRTGLVAFVLFLPLYLFLSLISGSVNRRTFFTYGLLIFTFVLMPVFIFSQLIGIESQEFMVNNVFNRAFVLYFNLIEHGTLSTTTTDVLVNDMMFLPDSSQTLIFGDARWVSGQSNYMYTDSGYVRYIFGMGLIGCGLYYWAIAKTLFSNMKNYKERAIKITIVALYILIAAAEMKEPFFSKAGIGRILSLLFMAGFLKTSEG